MSDQTGDQTEAELEKTRQVVRENIEAQTAQNEEAAAKVAAQAAPAEDVEDVEATGWDAYTKADLEDELRNRDLPVSGTKDELVARLDQDDRGA